MQDLNDKVTGNTLPATEWNEVPTELQNIIEDTGQTLSGVDLDQLGKGIASYVASGDFYIDSGTANSYVLSGVGSKQVPPAYVNGMKIRFLPANSNTGASTVNVATLGVKNLRRVDGTALQANDLQATVPVSFQYDTASGTFLKNGESLPDATETLKGKAEIATQAETDAGTDDARIVTPKKLRFGVSMSLSTNGYIAFPSWLGGIIVQWGETGNLSVGGNTITYNITFPNAVDSLQVTPKNDFNDTGPKDDNWSYFGATKNTNSSFTLYNRNYNGGTAQSRPFHWLAIGH